MSVPERRAWNSEPPEFTQRRLADAAPLYKSAYEEARGAVEAQTAELDALRQRAGTFLSFVGASTAFLVGSTLQRAGERDATFYVMAATATLVSLVAIICACRVFLPVSGWQGKLSAEDLVVGWIETDVPPTETLYFRAFALLHDEMRVHNEGALRKLRRALTGEVLLGSLQVILWASFAWISG